jgi:hypothetical protein
VDSLSDDEIAALAAAIHERLAMAVELGGAAYEVDLYGEHGRYDSSYLRWPIGKASPARCAARRY